ncbi:uncharacterized protein MONOS_14031 [Monocercomonoides exilis]|uniref:uncharacterized protein n=1 Tax=Monocercomonoides exilis TaxID=2049356 RepID=UPI0035596E12|nr:hypothetical protein MONOS_14031 [Monocercomonoides exilis]|eukprot:MONOS_14031.1-p1 / transcript=MONOS_14031.1 / gene=MONOS_14031 / organism=Monocercomonoides_exilis_PA203 / gene_product=unspecified product / transcript_product=unspecified product / location=Mono_scaffold00924:22442-23410(+) / protein_length=281 / sequence_SO=supercontig / SO=protein_coding / is_pseudo=false
MMQDTDNTKMFNKLFSGLEDCNEDEQRKKIGEMNALMEEMDKEEFYFIFTKTLFDKILKMTDEKKLNFGNTILLLKHIGYCTRLKRIFIQSFGSSSLNKRIEEIIINENEKKEGKDENFLANICECYHLFNYRVYWKLLGICIPCILKAILNKEENEEAQKEKEISLLALGNIYKKNEFVDDELYLKEMKEIIQHHQEYHDLTRLAYQSAWHFLIERLYNSETLQIIMVNELHFAREAAKELEELLKCVDWKKKEGGGGKVRKEVDVIERWLEAIGSFFF